MRSRTAVLAAMLAIAPLGAKAADFVVWWEEGLYPREDAAVAEVVAAFEQESGKEVELVFQPIIEILNKAQAAIETGRPPDFVFGLTVGRGFDQWAYKDRLVDLPDTVGPLASLFDADALKASTLLNGRTGKRALYTLPIGISTNHIHIWKSLLEQAGFTLADVPKEWDAFWSFWCDEVQPAVRRALGSDDIWGVGLPMSIENGDTWAELAQFQAAQPGPIGEGATTMCVRGCLETVGRRLSRRGFVTAAGVAAAAGTAALFTAPVRAAEPRSFTRVVDLTHVMGPDFPTYFGPSNLEIETLKTLAKDGVNLKRWLLVEHTGTHMDAPIHFGDAVQSADEIPVEHLVVPLVIVDIRAKAQDDADAQVTTNDLKVFEAAHGAVPDGACVAMLSGWDARASGPEFRNADGDGVMHFPGFHVEAAQYLMGERNAVGIAVDTLSLDYGKSADFATHYAWLPTNRWGLEAVAKLGELPPTGATLVVGGPKIKGATGGPSRVFALL